MASAEARATVGAHESSRDSLAGAGWTDCTGPGAWTSDVPAGTRPLSWLRPGTLWVSRNDIVAHALYDPVDRARARWVKAARQRARVNGWDEDFVTRRGDGDSVSFLALGDPGEGDNSQYAVARALESQADGALFAVICSDIVYPSGETRDYGPRFYRPYHRLELPIFGVPGNHDWLDGLRGFMQHFCDLEAPDGPPAVTRHLRGFLACALWRRSKAPGPAEMAAMRGLRSLPGQIAHPPQPCSYWAVDAGPLRIVAIDTGIVGAIDAEQAAWLRRVSLDSDRPKVLLTGKPLYADGRRYPGAIAGQRETIDDLVRDPRANYVAVIGGDTHNYQRYPVALGDGRTIHHVVCGGGGAFTHATHPIPHIAGLEGVGEEDFRCYPLRGDSLARFAQIYDDRVAGGRGLLTLEPDEAATYVAEVLGVEPTRGTRVRLSPRARRVARLVYALPAKRGFHRFASEVFNWNDPPLFNHFLRVDASPTALRLRCFGVTGCAGAEASPPVEDEVTIPL